MPICQTSSKICDSVEVKTVDPFQTPFGNHSRAHEGEHWRSVFGEGVSNPFRELFSRAQKPIRRKVHVNTTFQTPFGNYSRAHSGKLADRTTWYDGFKPLSGIILARTSQRLRRFRRLFAVSNPFRESFSRARKATMIVITLSVLCFKPLSGIILARTERKKAIVGERSKFQTPFGNYSRAHTATYTRDGKFQIKFQTPFGNYSRAHRVCDDARVCGNARFKPLSGIILARTYQLVFLRSIQ